MQDEPAVRLQPPPPPVLLVVNPLMRRLLRTPLARRMPASLALLEYTGRRSGRRYSTPVGVHELTSGTVVFTEAPWRRNFAGGADVTVRRSSSVRRGRGELVEDQDAVADALLAAVQQVGARDLALRTRPGHTITRDDLLALRRTMIRLQLDGATA